MLALRGGRVVAFHPLDNVAASPVFYELDATAQLKTLLSIEDAGCDLAIYHSHTRTAAYPSPTDVKLAAYPDALYVIVSLAKRDDPEIRAYWIKDGTITEEPVN
jgi:proteasome lid subunit RPN8/RPN11